jgi:hypothetical protein
METLASVCGSVIEKMMDYLSARVEGRVLGNWLYRLVKDLVRN